jgi:hypothetical protein
MRFLFLYPFLAGVCLAQLTTFQRVSDFQQLVAQYGKRYAPYEWKRIAVRYDGMNMRPWLDRVNQSTSDLDFMEICMEYVARYQDSHAGFTINSAYNAQLGFRTDVYDNRVIVDAIDTLPPGIPPLPFEIGDELVALDGKTAEEWLQYFRRFLGDGNAISARRLAAFLITTRPQALLPTAHEIGATAVVTVRRQTGDSLRFEVPWRKSGVPFLGSPAQLIPTAVAEEADPRPWSKMIRDLDRFRITNRLYFSGLLSVQPVFDLPAGFAVHKGKQDYDSIFSGTFRAGALRLGYLRIPSFEDYYSDVPGEIEYLADTDGLILDLMGNPGGSVCAAEDTARMLFPTEFQSLTHQVRLTWDDVRSIEDYLEMARISESFTGESEDVVTLQGLLSAFRDAYQKGSPMTAPMAFCGGSNILQPAADRRGKIISYQKPILVLTDERTASAAEVLAAILQDNNRALLFGMRSNGAGGAVEMAPAGAYGEGRLTLTRSLVLRKQPIVTTEFPAASYIENIGVRPNIVNDYMTRDNLTNRGKSFVESFTKALVDRINARPN